MFEQLLTGSLPRITETGEVALGHNSTKLEDIQHLRHLIEVQKLSGLKKLDISGNDIQLNVVAVLIYVCVSNHQRELVVKMSDT